MLNRISRIFRREGVRGFYVRLRHPKQRSQYKTAVPTVRPPFMIVGGTLWQAEQLRQALVLLLGSEAVAEVGQSAIRLSPAIIEPAPDGNSVVLWSTPDEVCAFCHDGARARRWLAGAAAILVPSAACFQRLADLSLAEDRIFVLTPIHTAPLGRNGELAGALARWLIAAGVLHPGRVDPALFSALDEMKTGARLCLSLPESPRRRQAFLTRDLDDFKIFNGIRLLPGWIGCGWSYRTIACAALARDAVPLVVCEDDMIPLPGFRRKLKQVEDYLGNQDWDLFSGLLTDLSETARIEHVCRQDGLTFVHLNYTTGMVMNIYGSRVLTHLAAWDPEAGTVETNTIDAWLSNLQDLRVVTTIPFLAGHDSRVRSTLFGFANSRYDGMIRASEARLLHRVMAFEQAKTP